MAGSEGTDSPTAAAALKPAAARNARKGEPDAAPAASTVADQARVARHGVRFDATAEIAYHALMEGALDQWHRVIMGAIIVSGTAAAAGVAQFLPGEWNTPLSLAASLLVVVASTLDFGSLGREAQRRMTMNGLLK